MEKIALLSFLQFLHHLTHSFRIEKSVFLEYVKIRVLVKNSLFFKQAFVMMINEKL